MPKKGWKNIKKQFIITILVVSLTVSASAQIQISPNTFEENINSGENITEEITLEWSGETTTVAELELNVFDSENNSVDQGFEPGFTDEQFILNSGQPKNKRISIQTVSNLEPGEYKLELNATSTIELETLTETETVTSGSTVIREIGELNETEEQDLNQTIEFLEDAITDLENELDDQESDDSRNQTIEELENEKEDLEELVDSLREELNETATNQDRGFTGQFYQSPVADILLFAILFTIAFIHFNRDKIKDRLGLNQKGDLHMLEN